METFPQKREAPGEPGASGVFYIGSKYVGPGSDYPLVDHGIRHFHEAGDVGAGDVVGEGFVGGVFMGVGHGVCVDVGHDGLQLVVHFFTRPGEALAVLGHFQAGGGHTAGIGGLGRAVQDFGGQVGFNAFQIRRHVGAFRHQGAAVLDEGAGVFPVDFILRGGGESAVARNAPGTLAFKVLGFRELLHVFRNASAALVLEFHDPGQLFRGNAVRIVNIAVGVGHRDRFRAQFVKFFHGVLGHIAGTGHQADFALQVVVAGGEHVLGEVYATVAGGFRADEGAAPVQALAGENAGEFVADSLVLSEQVADFAAAHADIPRGNVRIRADVALKLRHEALAEAHHFIIALALGIEVGTALAAAHGEGGEGVFENLFKTQELQDAEVDAGMEAEAALVRSDGAVEFHTVPAVHLNLALVIDPRHAEQDGSFRFHDPFQNRVVFILGIRGQNRFDRAEHFLNGLDEFFFVAMLGLHQVEHALGICLCHLFCCCIWVDALRAVFRTRLPFIIPRSGLAIIFFPGGLQGSVRK